MFVLSGIEKGSSPSSSIDGDEYEYDVFLSFKGLDTRNSFTNHLCSALKRANITTFMDDDEILKEGDLKLEWERVIKAARASVIVLSETYASSTWCLNELVMILKEHMTSNHIVIPIYYHVDPSHVRKQIHSFGDAMAHYKHTMELETNENKRSQRAQKIDQWSKALTKVAELVGWDVKGWRETEFIDEIVKDVCRRLHISSRGPLPQLIGMDYSINLVTSWLTDASSHTTDILTILGIGGIGKTSLAKYVYGLHYHEFGTSSFIEAIIQVQDISVYTSKIENVVTQKEVFIVLDDINSLKQLNALLGSKCFYPGSKVIVTTKDASLTERCELFNTNTKPKHTKHEIKGLHETKVSTKIEMYTHNIHPLSLLEGSNQAPLRHPEMKQPNHTKIPLEAIKSCTYNFNERNFIGKGGYGKVYKGILTWGDYVNHLVAVKRLDLTGFQGNKEFHTELTILSQYQHKNIITLIGFCDDNKEMILVYEYARHGSLDTYLRDTTKSNGLSWPQLLKICIGVASALDYLHNHVAEKHRIIHRDIKSANILLDENWNAKLADFGLSRIGLANQSNTFVITNLAGTYGYCDPQYEETGYLTKESDVYSFGVVLFEVLCGRLACDFRYSNERRFLSHFARTCYKNGDLEKFVDQRIINDIKPSTFLMFSTIAYQCLHKNREERPTIGEVEFQF
ncbi:hypothetical protein LXL04_033704 [Taraxacum kok-saghyz]